MRFHIHVGVLTLQAALALAAHRTQRHVSCEHPSGTPGKCVRWNLCPDENPKDNPKCESSTGLHLVCCKNYKEPEGTDKCGVRPVPTILQPKSLVAEAIVGGSEAWPTSWPWAVAIFDKASFTCGATMISPTCIITAAHCFEGLNPNPKDFYIRLGDHNLRHVGPGEDPEEQKLSRITLHPEFRPNHSDHDLALLTVEMPIPRTPICLPSKELKGDTFVGRYAVVAGWGTTQYDANNHQPFSSVLQEIPVPVKPTAFCEERYKAVADYKRAFRDGLEEKRFMCAGYEKGGRDACLGDSGGPLMAELSPGRWHLVGVVCIGFGCGMAGYPGIYTRVTQYQDWIEEQCGIK